MNGTFEISSRRGYTLVHLAMVDHGGDEREEMQQFVSQEESPRRWIADQAADLPQVRIVLVDDHQVLRDSLKANLRQIPGVTIVGEASDGQTAVELVRAVRPDIVVMDMVMPGMNGVEATKIILREQPQVRVIGLSMYNEAYMVERMMKAGAARYLSKTASFEDLQATLSELRVDLMRSDGQISEPPTEKDEDRN